MEFSIFKNKGDGIIAQNNSQRFTIAVLAATVVAEGVIIGWLASNQRTVFMPPANITKEFWIEGNAVSKTYLDMAMGHVSENLLNITPENARKSMNTILPLVQANFYEEYKKQIERQASYLMRNNVSQTFYRQNIDYSKNGVADVQGILNSIVGDRVISTKQIHLNIAYKVSDGKFTILKINLKDNMEQINDDMKAREADTDEVK